MCGLAGFLDDRPGRTQEELEGLGARLARCLQQRGPDAEGIWADEREGIALGHRRLAILDLSPAGAQPMASREGRYLLVTNGEIFNFRSLRADVDEPWRGHSDTEVMLALIERLGVGAAVSRWAGMFAFALWDRHERTLTLGRDRLGEKPLYYGHVAGSWVFASDLPALTAFPGFRRELDLEAVALYLRHDCVPAPHCIYRGLRKLPPGHLAVLRAGEEPRLEAYWRPEPGQARAPEELEGLLRRAVTERLEADRPLGFFLSGGIDSSLVTALAGGSPLTFAVGFAEGGYDESPHAEAVARHLGTRHTTLRVTAADALAVVPRLPEIYAEPFADSSQLPTVLLCRAVRQHVTVALSGDGGDELFLGYRRYELALRAWRLLRPWPFRRVVAGLLARLPLRHRHQERAWAMLASGRLEDLYRALLSVWQRPDRLLGRALAEVPWPSQPGDEDWLKLSRLDLSTYLPDDLLVKVDRASMAVGLEVRAPFLDHRLVEWALAAPVAWKRQKRVLKQQLAGLVPRPLWDRPKQGFGVPLGAWLRGPLRDWGDDLLQGTSSLLDLTSVRAKWQAHLSGRMNDPYPLWNILALLQWLRHQDISRQGEIS